MSAGHEEGIEKVLGNSVLLTKLDEIIGWGRKYSFFLYPFVTACCGMEFMSLAGPRYDLDRFPILVKVYNQMTEPKWVFSFGVCATSGGFYDNYATVQGIDTLIPVDVYVPGCPPRPEMVIDGLLRLQQKVAKERWSDWPRGEAPVTKK